MILFSTNYENNILNVFNRQILVFHEVAIGNQILLSYIVKDVGMRNEASPKSVRPVIRPVIHPLSICPVVHANRVSTPWKLRGCWLHTIPLLSLTLQLSAHEEWEGNKPGMK